MSAVHVTSGKIDSTKQKNIRLRENCNKTIYKH